MERSPWKSKGTSKEVSAAIQVGCSHRMAREGVLRGGGKEMQLWVKGRKCRIRDDFEDIALSNSTSLSKIWGKAQLKGKI